MSDKAFNFIRFLAEIGITAVGTFYKVVAEIWSLPYGEAVLATCVALSTLIGLFTEWQRSQYNKLKLDFTPILEKEEELNVHVDAEDIE